jgi:hypothetical protein
MKLDADVVCPLINEDAFRHLHRAFENFAMRAVHSQCHSTTASVLVVPEIGMQRSTFEPAANGITSSYHMRNSVRNAQPCANLSTPRPQPNTVAADHHQPCVLSFHCHHHRRSSVQFLRHRSRRSQRSIDVNASKRCRDSTPPPRPSGPPRTVLRFDSREIGNTPKTRHHTRSYAAAGARSHRAYSTIRRSLVDSFNATNVKVVADFPCIYLPRGHWVQPSASCWGSPGSKPGRGAQARNGGQPSGISSRRSTGALSALEPCTRTALAPTACTY